MSIEIVFVEKIPNHGEMEAFLTSYYEVMIEKMIQAGGPAISTELLMSDLWETMPAYLPPNGAVALAHNAQSILVGCGFLKKIRPDAAELKRLSVSPAARGAGLGRRLIEARIDFARDIGVRDLFADTVKGNTQMLSLYQQLGFEPIDRYPENANPEGYDPWLVYLHRKTGL